MPRALLLALLCAGVVLAAAGSVLAAPNTVTLLDPSNPHGDGTPPVVGGADTGSLVDLSGNHNDGMLSGFDNPVPSGYVLSGKPNSPYALHFDGVDDVLGTSTHMDAPTAFSLSIWFRTTASEGKLIGFQCGPFATGGCWDRQIELDAGHLSFGVWPNPSKVTSPLAYNDGRWHLATATFDASQPVGMRLYVDGALVASAAQEGTYVYGGWWAVGNGQTWWTAEPYTGDVGQIQIDDAPLGDAGAAQVYAAGAGPSIPTPELGPLALVGVGLIGVALVARRLR